MILGSHNTMSYLKPQWWIRPFAYTARCQDKTIEEQYKAGVRCFDLRVRFDKGGHPYFCHGLMEYRSVSVTKTISWLNAQEEGVFVRLVYEGTPTQTDRKYFYEMCDWIEKYCSFLMVQSVIKKPWEVIDDNLYVNLTEAQVSPYDWKSLLTGPKRLLPLQEERLENLKDYSGIVLQDFV